MNSPKVEGFNYKGYEEIAEKFGLSAAVSIPLADRRLIATSGHVGMHEDGHIAKSLREQMRLAFKNVEKSIHAVDPSLTSTDVWNSVYQITTYHVGGVGEEITGTMNEIAKSFLGSHRPAWAAIGVQSLAAGDFEMLVWAVI
ncbi:hypothetical protein A1O3_06927 [Capronia epimyces CBS 606.96]|uniref:Uncharacterized protein n=1 Tax=Capronia epimyces CBS 606.96 TaxID=1182542 RepID=W9XK94_9EURO|nr:uncharacterized protein A1O3_06927 [Capronia epimyces CBS 606.96]EXJ80643.1 hypothetical protein A1O3_06927 [Capronia epimyces CBS 606.96]